MNKILTPMRAVLLLTLVVCLATVTGVWATENTIDYSYQVWDGLGYGEPLIVRTPIVVSAMPESQFGAIFKPVEPVKMTPARIDEINLAVSCGFTHRMEYLPANTLRLTIDAAAAECPGDPQGEQRTVVGGLILECAAKVADEQLARYAPGQNPRFILRLFWGDNDPRNREKVLPPAD